VAKTPKKPKIPKEIEYDFIKSNYFRVIRADGAFGGLSPNGAIHMGIYSERHPIPRKVVHTIQSATEGGAAQLGPEIAERREGRKAIVREMEVDVVLDIVQAITLRKWLDERIAQYQEMVGPLPIVDVVTTQDQSTNGKGKRK
jgi:hypothetical protein